MKPFFCPEFMIRRLVLLLMALTCPGAAGLFAAPLENGYPFAPGASSSAEEKAAASREARLMVVNAAAKYENIPYRYAGMDRNGLDCSGLIYLSFREALQVSLPRSATSLHAWAERIPDEQTQPGDLLFFKTDNTGKISHVAIYAGNGRFIHAASSGPVTGVIYSTMGEPYWAGRYAGAGRALPESDIADRGIMALSGAGQTGGYAADSAVPADSAGGGSGITGAVTNADGGAAVRPGRIAPSGGNLAATAKETHFTLGFALAPSWSGFYGNGGVLRGFASQVRTGYSAALFNKPMLFGLELRPEWDESLGVFRLPVTLSWGFDDRFRVFLGPAVSIGDAALETPDERRVYSGGTSLLGAIGVTAAPFLFKVAGGELAPYAELAWQSYISDNPDANLNADISAALRFSTGIRYTWKFR
jgi:probable lipoprotein NlpC